MIKVGQLVELAGTRYTVAGLGSTEAGEWDEVALLVPPGTPLVRADLDQLVVHAERAEPENLHSAANWREVRKLRLVEPTAG